MNPDLSEQTLTELAEVARDVAVRCGRLIVDERPAHVEVAQTKTSAVDVVTLMDRRSEELAHRLLAELRPGDGLLGEEGLTEPGTTGISWVIDPIDGTVNYLYDIPLYAVSVAAVAGDPRVAGDWRPVAAAVYNPVPEEIFTAAQGQGAQYRCGEIVQQLRPRPAETLEHSLVGTGFGYEAEVRTRQGQVLARLLPQIRDIRRSGSAALDLCNVALGRTDAYYEEGLNPWDMAGGWLVCAESGCFVTGLDTPHPTKQMTVVGTEAICRQIVEILRDDPAS